MQASSQAEAESCWSTIANDVLYWESWDEQHAVFDSLSGETHLLPELTAHVLRKLGEYACTARQLAEALCAETDESCEEHFVLDITRLLQQLQAVGLVEESTP
ncbi:MAG: HPr-rel-A system PqqD family peptide chaperone [Gammaproteobacteria bacterium]|nr:HPr-rel-A system PqqD family peptide chaperone [Gammaproteobacteria bacterium]